jgi:hypothetical protein
MVRLNDLRVPNVSLATDALFKEKCGMGLIVYLREEIP